MYAYVYNSYIKTRLICVQEIAFIIFFDMFSRKNTEFPFQCLLLFVYFSPSFPFSNIFMYHTLHYCNLHKFTLHCILHEKTDKKNTQATLSRIVYLCLVLLQVPKCFVPAQKPILLKANHPIVWHRMFVTATICKQNFGLAQKIWTSTKYFGTCKRTRHQSHSNFT